MNIIKKRCKDFYNRFISLKGEPANIAMGMAIGVFIGVTPTIPFHTAMIIAVGILFKQNITAGYLGSWLISNPVTIPVLYFCQYELGSIILGLQKSAWAMNDYSLEGVMNLGWHILFPLLIGGIITAPFFAVPAYFLARRFVVVLRERNRP
ncbi:MAG: DUF2062 domain-containing protein [Syntrophales bacterium]|jgi:hypothetical protein|nr:DUF2062 domain-containing protein [Syntrophales bacterium]MCK9392383.1 DUF2062 domain-containing protein [Syntrophales bacterium]